MTKNSEATTPHTRRLIAGAVVTAVLATVLLWAGWRLTGTTRLWEDAADPDNWLGHALRAGGVLLFSKTGLKIGLVVVGVAVGGTMWLRARRIGD